MFSARAAPCNVSAVPRARGGIGAGAPRQRARTRAGVPRGGGAATSEDSWRTRSDVAPPRRRARRRRRRAGASVAHRRGQKTPPAGGLIQRRSAMAAAGVGVEQGFSATRSSVALLGCLLLSRPPRAGVLYVCSKHLTIPTSPFVRRRPPASRAAGAISRGRLARWQSGLATARRRRRRRRRRRGRRCRRPGVRSGTRTTSSPSCERVPSAHLAVHASSGLFYATLPDLPPLLRPARPARVRLRRATSTLLSGGQTPTSTAALLRAR